MKRSSWLATLPRTERMNAKAAKVAKGAAAHLIASLAVTRGGQLCDLSGLCVHRRGCDRSLTRPWGEQCHRALSRRENEQDFSSCPPCPPWWSFHFSGRALGRLLEAVLSELRGEHLEVHLQRVGGARPVPRRILERPLDFPPFDLAVHSPGSLCQRAGQVDFVPRARLLGRQLCGG